MCQGWLIGNKGHGPQTRQQEVNVIGTPNGNLGGIAVVEETIYGETPAVPNWVWQHPAPSTLGLRREVIEPTLLSASGHSARGYSGKYADGDVVVGLELTNAIIGDILGLAGAFSVDHYRLAGGGAVDVRSLSVLLGYGGGESVPSDNHEWIYHGIKTNSLRIDLIPDSNSTLTLTAIGPGVIKTLIGSALDPNPPAEGGVFMPADLGPVTIGGLQVCLHSAVLEALVPKTGFDRRCMGGEMHEPISNGRPDVTFTLECDLDDTVSNNTINVLSSFVAGDPIGDINLGTDFVLANAVMTGDFPPLKEGQIDFTISGTAEYLDVFVT